MNEEKDRFGDVISLLERAREDVYFAAKDRELIDKLKRRLEETRQETLEHRAMSCPQCRSPLYNSSLWTPPSAVAPDVEGYGLAPVNYNGFST